MRTRITRKGCRAKEDIMEIRRATAKDLDGVGALLRQVNRIHHEGRPDIFHPGRKYDDDTLLQIFRDDRRPVFVATDGEDKVLGYAFCIMEETKGDVMLADMKSLYIDDLCVSEEARGTGIGKELYDHVRHFAKEQGCYHITLNVWTINPGAHAFYERMGMQPLKTVMEDIL